MPTLSRAHWTQRISAVVLMVSQLGWGSVPSSPAPNRESFSLDFWQEAHGLPQSNVRAVVQTRDGFLWLGTRGGLVRFDGVGFTSFTVKSGSLKDDEVWALKEDHTGVLWIGTVMGLTRMENGRFSTFTRADGLPDDWIQQIDEDRDGHLWIATASGVCRLVGSVFTTFTTKDGLARDAVNEVCASLPEGVYVLSGFQLHRFIDGRFVAQTSVAAASDGWLTNISKGAGDSLWLGFERGLVKRLQAGRLTTYPPPNDPSARGGRVLEDAHGNVWLGRRSGLFRLREGNFERVFPSEVNARLGGVLSLSTDREGSLWLGLQADGLARVRQTQFTTLTVDDGLPDNETRTVFQDSRGDIWIGTVNSLAQWSRGRIISYREFNGTPMGSVSAIGEDRDGTVWIGSAGELLRMQSGQLTKDQDWQRKLNITTIYRDAQGNMWVGTDGEGLFRFADGRRTVLRTPDGLASNRVRGILVDRKGALWVATFGGGVSRYADGKFTTFTTKDGLGNDRVVGIHEDADGALWFSTRSGLTCYREGRFVSIRARDGLYSDFVSSLLEDGHGYFWCSCSQGLFRVSQADLAAFVTGQRRTVSSEAYGIKDGLRTTAFSAGLQPNACRTTDGRLLFCSPKGLVVLDPAVIFTNAQKPPVYVERAQINRRAVPVEQSAVIPPGAGEVEIHYTALGFLAPDKIRFKYRLEGFDPDWVEAGTRRFAYYAHLPAGAYRFHVIACNEDGLWNDTGAAFAFTLTPFFYERTWFHAACVLGALGLIGAVFRWRVARLKASKWELQQRVEEALANVKMLRGLLPICASCKKVRDDQGYWNQIEVYLREHSETQISHGICPDCVKKLYPEVSDKILQSTESKSAPTAGNARPVSRRVP